MPSDAAPSPVQPCPQCGSAALRRDRIRRPRSVPVLVAVACAACGEWWFESGGARLSTEAIIRLGLAR